MRGLGYRPDPKGIPERIYGASRALVLPDKHLEYVELAPSPIYQDSAEACVGFGIVIAAYAKMKAEGLVPVLGSPGFIWWNSRLTHGDEKLNVGTYPSRAIETLNDLGMCPEEDWPIKDIQWRFHEKPSRLAYRNAYDSRFDIEYSKIYGQGEELKRQIKSAFVTQGPLTFGLMVTESFVQLAEHDVYNEPGSDDPIKGGHYLAALGYDELGVVGLNSWRYWGNDGWFRIGWDYFLNAASDIVTYKFIPNLG